MSLRWTVAPDLTLGQPHVEDGRVHVPATIPAAWQGYTYRLDRSSDLRSWCLAQELGAAGSGTLDLHDATPMPGFSIYRVRPDRP